MENSFKFKERSVRVKMEEKLALNAFKQQKKG